MRDSIFSPCNHRTWEEVHALVPHPELGWVQVKAPVFVVSSDWDAYEIFDVDGESVRGSRCAIDGSKVLAAANSVIQQTRKTLIRLDRYFNLIDDIFPPYQRSEAWTKLRDFKYRNGVAYYRGAPASSEWITVRQFSRAVNGIKRSGRRCAWCDKSWQSWPEESKRLVEALWKNNETVAFGCELRRGVDCFWSERKPSELYFYWSEGMKRICSVECAVKFNRQVRRKIRQRRKSWEEIMVARERLKEVRRFLREAANRGAC